MKTLLITTILFTLYCAPSQAGEKATGTGVGQSRAAAYNAARSAAMNQLSGPKPIKIVSTTTQKTNAGYVTTITVQKLIK